MKTITPTLPLLFLTLIATGCSQGEASPAAQAEAVTAAAEAPAQEAGAVTEGIRVAKVSVELAPSYVEGQGPEWAVQINGKNEGDAAEGLEYRVELVDAKGHVFATHGSQIWFNPEVPASESIAWATRIPRREDQPEAEGVTAKVNVLKRLTKESLTEGWKPLDPNNLPPAREVKLDGKGNVISDSAEAAQRVRG